MKKLPEKLTPITPNDYYMVSAINELREAVAELQGEVKGYKDCCTVCLPVPTRGFRRTDGSFHCGSCCSCHTAKVSAPTAKEAIPNDAVYKQGVAFGRDDERRRVRKEIEKISLDAHCNNHVACAQCAHIVLAQALTLL